MPSNCPLADELQRVGEAHYRTGQSDLARRGETLDAYKVMSHEDLALLAWQTAELCSRLGGALGYLTACAEQHIETDPADIVCGYVISQAAPGGEFNKFVKTVGGYAPESGPSGDVLVFEQWKDAKAALDHLKAPEMRIYPVVLAAGFEPRTTHPKEN